jgi:hypothetical protein
MSFNFKINLLSFLGMSEGQNGINGGLTGSIELEKSENPRLVRGRLGPAPFLPKTRDTCEDKRVYNLDPGAENPR